MFRIPLLNTPAQLFSIMLGNKRATFEIYYNATAERWHFNLYRDENFRDPVVHGRKMIVGVDLLQVFEVDFGVLFISDYEKNGLPTDYDMLMSGKHQLWWASYDEMFAVAETKGEVPTS